MLNIKGIIKDIGFSIDEDDLIEETDSGFKIIDARILNRRVKEGWVVKCEPSMTILVTFEDKRKLEKKSIFSYILHVNQCINCLRFGHRMNQCRSKIRCENCVDEHDSISCFSDFNYQQSSKDNPILMN